MIAAPTYAFCLGATKAGTSWLHAQLAAHPDCALRTIKEYHYFTKVRPADFAAAIAANDLEIARLTAKSGAQWQAGDAWAARHITDLTDYNALLRSGVQDRAGFADLLRGAGTGTESGRVCGDFTPAYALLPEKALAGIAAFAPGARAIYLIRDPVARLWSHVRMIAARARPADLTAAATALLTRILDGATDAEAKGVTTRGDYAAIIPRLARAFAPPRLLVMFYEDMLTGPGYARLCDFLGIAHRPPEFSRTVHGGTPALLAQDLCHRAAGFLRPQYDFIAQRFPALPEPWRAAMNEA